MLQKHPDLDFPQLGQHPSSQKKGLLAFFRQHKWIRRGLYVLLILFLLQMSVRAVGHAIGRLTILEFFLALTPSQSVDGINILAFGIDETRAVKRSDTIILFHLDTQRNRIGALSIPRDTRVNIPGHGMNKLNHAYAYGGASLLKETASNFLGVPIQHHVQINLRGIETLIDALGGLSLTVEKDLYYEDKAGGLKIDIKEGFQTLTGKQAIQYLRFRQDNEGDIGRIRRQQTLLKTLANKATSMGTLLELPRLFSALKSTIRTDMGPRKMMGLALRFKDAYASGTLDTATVPGAIRLINGASYWKADTHAMEDIISRVISGFAQPEAPIATVSTLETPDKTASEEPRRQVNINEVTRITEQTSLETDTQIILGNDIQVEILNGVGIPGAARIAAAKIKELGLKVPRYDNAGSFNYDKTLIVDWKGQIETSVALAASLGIDPSNIIVYDRPSKPLNFTIVLGQDWEQFFK